MATKLLPDSGVTSMVQGNDIFAFAQDYKGNIRQFGGSVESDNSFTVVSRKDRTAVERTIKGGVVRAGSPKLFTPIAAVPFIRQLNTAMTERYVIYLDDNNILNNAYMDATTGGDYEHGTLHTLGIRAAHYSGLAAVSVPGSLRNFIGVFYQDPGADAAVKMVSFNGYSGRWEAGKANLRDPPLFGTSITAVAPRAGLLGRKNPNVGADNENQPVYYLQLDNNALGSGQGESEPLPVALGYEASGKPMVFSPHTSLTAVDNGKKLHLVYKSHSGKIKVVHIGESGVEDREGPEKICEDITVAPRSAIAACLAPNSGANTRLVLFYQGLETVSRKVKLMARVAFKPAIAGSKIPWQVSGQEELGE